METPFIYNDGGRAEAGYSVRPTPDCVTRAIAIAAQLPYSTVYDELAKRCKLHPKLKSHPRTGVHKKIYVPYLEELGFEWVATMKIGAGCTTHLTPTELPEGRLVVRLSRHLSAVINGVVNDTYDCSRDGSRCVYGYYIKK